MDGQVREAQPGEGEDHEVSEELRPCVFCGHDGARIVVEDEVTDAGAEDATVPLYAASCPYCGAIGPMALTEGEAVEAWNRRAKRTCRPEVCDDGAGAWGVYCSGCGYRFAGPHGNREVPEHMATRRDIMPRYCQNCGARVEVGE